MNNYTRYWCLTWGQTRTCPDLVDISELSSFLNNLCSICVFQLERGLKSDKLHYQGGLVLYGSRTSKKELLGRFQKAFGDVTGLTLSSARDINFVMSYSSKLDTRVSGPFYVGRDEPFDEKFASMDLKIWQADLYNFLRRNATNQTLLERKIIWIHDSVGCTGKSYFMKWLRLGQHFFNCRKLPVSTVDRLMSAVAKIKKNSVRPVNIFSVDLTKSRGKEQNLDDLFSALEDIKNGYVVDVMYGKYVEVLFDPPIILVFTNEPYSKYQKCLTQDRWFPLSITSDGGISYIHKNDDGTVTPFLLRDYILD